MTMTTKSATRPSALPPRDPTSRIDSRRSVPENDNGRSAPENDEDEDNFNLWVSHQRLADQRQALRTKQTKLSEDKAKINEEIARAMEEDLSLEKRQEALRAGKPADWVLEQAVKFGTHPHRR